MWKIIVLQSYMKFWWKDCKNILHVQYQIDQIEALIYNIHCLVDVPEFAIFLKHTFMRSEIWAICQNIPQKYNHTALVFQKCWCSAQISPQCDSLRIWILLIVFQYINSKTFSYCYYYHSWEQRENCWQTKANFDKQYTLLELYLRSK